MQRTCLASCRKETRILKIRGRRPLAVTVEAFFWTALAEAAARDGLCETTLLARLARNARDGHAVGRAVRDLVIGRYRAQAAPAGVTP